MIRSAFVRLGVVSVALIAIGGENAIASPALDDDASTTPSGELGADGATAFGPAVEYGVGVRLRNVRIPQAELELFLDRAGGGASNVGLGIDLIRRRGNLELQLGFEFEHLQPGEGVWIANGDDVAGGDEADFLLAPDHAPNGDQLGWFTAEFTFLNHAPITKNIAFRYGGGLGLGIRTGDLYRYDVICAAGTTNDAPEQGCKPASLGGTGSGSGPIKYSLPPVFPVVNAIIGLQVKPTEKVTINVEGGIRTFLFFGMSGAYFF